MLFNDCNSFVVIVFRQSGSLCACLESTVKVLGTFFSGGRCEDEKIISPLGLP
jgi:hypothetical protein